MLCYFYQGWLSNCIKNAWFWYLLSMDNGMMYCKERHPLLLKCFITFLSCRRKMMGASDSIMIPSLCFILCHICPDQLLNCLQNTSFGVPSQHGKWDAIPKWVTSIAAGVFHNLPNMHKEDGKSFWQFQWAPHGSCGAISAHVDSQIAYKMLHLWYPPWWEMGWHYIQKDMHCCWSVSKASSDV